MDRERFEQWEAIEKALEINAKEQTKIKKKIKELTGKTHREVVEGSMPEFPYLKKKFIVEGVDISAINDRLERLRIKEQEMEGIKLDMEQWIDQEPDIEMQNILTLAYRDGMTHQQVGNELGYDRSTISQKIRRYWPT